MAHGEFRLPSVCRSTPKTAVVLFAMASFVFGLVAVGAYIKPRPDAVRAECAKNGKVMAEYMHGGKPYTGCVTIK